MAEKSIHPLVLLVEDFMDEGGIEDLVRCHGQSILIHCNLCTDVQLEVIGSQSDLLLLSTSSSTAIGMSSALSTSASTLATSTTSIAKTLLSLFCCRVSLRLSSKLLSWLVVLRSGFRLSLEHGSSPT